MGYGKTLDYINPMNLWYIVKDTVVPKHQYKATQTIPSLPVNAMNLSRVGGRMFIRMAGLSGAVAVAMGAYGSHAFYNKPVAEELKAAYKTANYYHFLHTLALLAVPLTNRPKLVGALMMTGMIVFCGTCYAYALTGNRAFSKYTPYGGTCLIVAWLSMMA
ncbi:hypothetical protein JTE90_013259 [Oedothorax gibbosus]|uniref:Uncharacterized protein n=1 Tax=Oedothorax gibbosus TaxID=931172 RepID=A0AAV6VEQ0_9ARAC|nr:hypothetical protein JTE90_013259 [Oedothorax gibbosus]